MNKMEKLRKEVENCSLCKLSSFRTNTVFGEGPPGASILIIGEAPGREEDIAGRPFVGAAGKILDQLLNEVQIKREDLYITNVVKCRPPGNRTPTIEEINICGKYLKLQIKFLSPSIIITMGNIATQFILNTKEGITKIHGKIFTVDNSKVIPIYHPSYLLRYQGKGHSRLYQITKQDLLLLKKK